MYADNAMGIASGSQHSQDMAKAIIEKVSVNINAGLAQADILYDVKKRLITQQKNYAQTIHEENLVKGNSKNKTQWVDTVINKQFGHLGGTSEAKRQEQEKKSKQCSGGK